MRISDWSSDVCSSDLHEVIGRGHAERLVPLIAELADGGRADAIAIGCGPGSFAGVRIGVAAARALGLGWQAPVRGFSTLALVAAGAADAILDADGGLVAMERSEEHTSELQSLMRNSYAVFCLKKKKNKNKKNRKHTS